MNKRRKNQTIQFILYVAIILSFYTFYSFNKTEKKDINTKTVIKEDGNLVISYLDVGQGDSIFIELPNKECMLIDAGEKEYGDSVVSYVENRGYKTIDYLVGTHPHTDHIGGMSTVINNLDIKNIYMPKVNSNTKTYEELLNTISNKGLTIKQAIKGLNIIDSDDLKVNVLSPLNKTYSNLNDYSVVIKITYKNINFLFMGDASKTVEKTLTTDISADVLKVGHHGSSYSTSKDFLERVNPSYAIISVGKDNIYKHPSNTTINLLESMNIKIYRTDVDKTIKVISDGENINIEKE